MPRGELRKTKMVPGRRHCRAFPGPALQHLPYTAQPSHRRPTKMNRRFFITLTGAAALAWEHVVAGEPEAAPNYKVTDHWWAMLIDIDKCIGCGNCVRACAVENNVPEGFFRTWIERYQVDDEHMEDPIVDSPNGGMHGFPARAEGPRTASFK